MASKKESKLGDVFHQVRNAKADAVRESVVAEPVPAPVPEPVAASAPEPVPAAPPKGKPKGKKSDPDWNGYNLQLRKRTHRDASLIVAIKELPDLSEIVEQLLSRWVSEHADVLPIRR